MLGIEDRSTQSRIVALAQRQSWREQKHARGNDYFRDQLTHHRSIL
jgi:hypothetical protein